MHKLESSPIDVIRDPNTAIPSDLLNPHYLDRRFQQKNIGHVVFLAPGAVLDVQGRVEGAVYMNSDGYALWSKFQDFDSPGDQPELVRGSANYFEAALNVLLPKLHENSEVINAFGREIPGLKLQAVTSAISGMTLFSFNEFAVSPQTLED